MIQSHAACTDVQSTSISRAAAVPYYVKGLALGIPPYLVAIHFWTWVFTLPIFLAGRADFRQLYAASYMVRTGHAHELYDYSAQKDFQDKLVSQEQVALPFVSPAYQALIWTPLSWVSYRHAYFVFLAINCALLCTIFFSLQPWMGGLKLVFPWLPLAIVLGFLPVAAALIQGQDSVILTAILVGAFVALSRGHEAFAGALAGVALFKFQIILPIAVLFLFWRRWRFLFGFATVAIVLAGTSLWLVGFAQSKLYVQILLAIAGVVPAPSGLAQYPITLPAMANVHGFVFGMFGGYLPQRFVDLIVVFLSAVVFAWTVFTGTKIKHCPTRLLLAIPCSVLVGHHTYIHDLSVLLLPVVVFLGLYLEGEGQESAASGRFMARSAALMFVAPVIESFFPMHFCWVSIAVLIFLIAISRTSGTPHQSRTACSG